MLAHADLLTDYSVLGRQSAPKDGGPNELENNLRAIDSNNADGLNAVDLALVRQWFRTGRVSSLSTAKALTRRSCHRSCRERRPPELGTHRKEDNVFERPGRPAGPASEVSAGLRECL